MSFATISFLLILSAIPASPQTKDSCVECHAALEGELQSPTVAFKVDIHQHAGFSCHDCHGGDPTVDNPEISMSPRRGFRGKIAPTAVPKLCARCHSDANLIHRFKPQQRVDQLAQYLTSVHGQRLAAGDEAVATCVDCHGIHDIRAVKDPRGPVHPLRLPDTCARCHSDSGHMARYELSTGQYDEYRKSVHWEALAQRRDLSAPSCASCHGNHGATPPQVSSVAAVCGTCHALLEDLYNHSPHQPVFAAMELAGCITCHGNHEVLSPSDTMLAGEDSVCAQCHEEDSEGWKVASEMARLMETLKTELNRSEEILERARLSGMEVSEAFLQLREANQSLVKARVAVHNFQVDSVAEAANEGLQMAAQTYRAGETALEERDFRRTGLVASMLAILVTLAGLWLTIRTIERKPQDTSSLPKG